jgi:signal peptidase I
MLPSSMATAIGHWYLFAFSGRPPGGSSGTDSGTVEPATVLVVDDDPTVRGILSAYVTGGGYRAVEADGPARGLAALEGDATISLVLSDVRMPTSDAGLDFIRAVRRRWPELPLAAVTGYPDDLAELHGTPECPVLILPKPFRAPQIREVLRLGARPAAPPVAAPRTTRHWLLGGLQAAIALGLLLAALLAGIAPTFFGYESVVVLSGSMAPALEVGDLAVIAPVPLEALRVGDIVSYRSAYLGHVNVTHRLVAIQPGPGGPRFRTKGDANPVADPEWVQPLAIVGRVAYTVPKVGYIVDFAQQPVGKLLLICIPGLLLALDYLRALRR